MVEKQNFIVEEVFGMRLDAFLVVHMKVTRSHVKTLVSKGLVMVNGTVVTKAGTIVKSGDKVAIHYKESKKVSLEGVEVEVVYEGPDFLILNKPAGLIVHKPEHESDEPTLVDWLLSKYKELEDVGMQGRSGIVHRLDKNTSGLILVPRNMEAFEEFSKMFQERKIKKTYLAVVQGHPDKSGVIDFQICRDAFKRTKMSVADCGREAVTDYKVIEYFNDSSLVEANPLTGRMHQIRVHFAAIGHPLLGDEVYGIKSKLIFRQALHSYALNFEYKKNKFEFKKEVPKDFNLMLNKLRKKDLDFLLKAK